MITRSRSKTLCNFWIFPLAVLVVFVQGCATTKPTSVDPLAYKDRTKSSINEDVTVTVAVPTIAEAQAIYGVELAAKQIQPVWLEIKNDSADTYWFLPSGLDPNYFSPSEASGRYSSYRGALLWMKVSIFFWILFMFFSRYFFLHFLVNYPGLAHRIDAVVSVAGAINGSPIANQADDIYSKLGANLPFNECEPGDGGPFGV